MFNYIILFCQKPTEEAKKELTDRDVQEGFDITLTKHKGQVQGRYVKNMIHHSSFFVSFLLMFSVDLIEMSV